MMNDHMQRSLSGEIKFILNQHGSQVRPGHFWGVIQRAYDAGRIDQLTEIDRKTRYECAVISGLLGRHDMDMFEVSEAAKAMADLMTRVEPAEVEGIESASEPIQHA